MTPPHFRKFPKREKNAVPQTGSEPTAKTNAGHEADEITIRADRIVLGSSYPHRLRVVYFENPVDPVV
jgi:hypothetical protein